MINAIRQKIGFFLIYVGICILSPETKRIFVEALVERVQKEKK